jgi:Na+-transporting methylmalonyl-CoA/oxaloacetate decarboxylase gamma subunit
MLTSSRKHQILTAVTCSTLHISAAVTCLIGTFAKSISFYPSTVGGENLLVFAVLFIPALIVWVAVKLTLMAVPTEVPSESDNAVGTAQRNQTSYNCLAGSLIFMLTLSQRVDPRWMDSVSHLLSPEGIKFGMTAYCVIWSIGLTILTLRTLLLELKAPLYEPSAVTG